MSTNTFRVVLYRSLDSTARRWYKKSVLYINFIYCRRMPDDGGQVSVHVGTIQVRLLPSSRKCPRVRIARGSERRACISDREERPPHGCEQRRPHLRITYIFLLFESSEPRELGCLDPGRSTDERPIREGAERPARSTIRTARSVPMGSGRRSVLADSGSKRVFKSGVEYPRSTVSRSRNPPIGSAAAYGITGYSDHQ